MKNYSLVICVLLTVTMLTTMCGIASGSTVAHWEFEEGSVGSEALLPGSIIDSANGLNGDPVGGPVYVGTQNGYGSKGLHFDGINDRIFIQDDPLFAITESLTLEAIIIFDGVSAGAEYGNQIIFRGDNRGSMDSYYLAVKLDGTLVFSISDAMGERAVARTSSPLPTGQTLHVAGTLDDSTGEQKLYINGIEVVSQITDVRPFAQLDPLYDPGLGIGNVMNSEWDQWFDGVIAEVRISDEALAPNEFIPEPGTVIFLGFGSLALLKRFNTQGKQS